MIGIIGRPFAGKSTLCNMIEAETDFFVFRPGRLVRAWGDKFIRNDRSENCNRNIIKIVECMPYMSVIDGFPRGIDQLGYVDLVLMLDIKATEIANRLKLRNRGDDARVWERVEAFDHFLHQIMINDANIKIVTQEEGLCAAKAYWEDY